MDLLWSTIDREKPIDSSLYYHGALHYKGTLQWNMLRNMLLIVKLCLSFNHAVDNVIVTISVNE